MKYLSVLLAVFSLVQLNIDAFGKARILSLDELVAGSGLIAVVRTGELGKRDEKSIYPGRAGRVVVGVEVLRAIKGLPVGSKFNLMFNSAMRCPSVTYKSSETFILFANLQKNGMYSTYNYSGGKLSVLAGDKVRGYKFKGYKFQGKNILLSDAIKEIKAIVSRIEKQFFCKLPIRVEKKGDE